MANITYGIVSKEIDGRTHYAVVVKEKFLWGLITMQKTIRSDRSGVYAQGTYYWYSAVTWHTDRGVCQLAVENATRRRKNEEYRRSIK